MQLKKMVIKQMMSFVHTAKESSLMMCKEKYGCNASRARTDVMKNVRGTQGQIHIGLLPAGQRGYNT
jgi:dihydropteroate synthase